ncbi:FGGY-family carbohydrate kinase [Histidinibacterium lentulum]|uniref:Carbohydrate kinase n=1 Tax=Histidinibacterium lentulum TaxID=2480588 RepID=A0A3N2R7J6_9RHOB|nr:FGGY-family carbohydrate kinase [Histidinibacterium lentulum]ROU03460.1 carbohydrate kinase [Histidinibacterium lentulum]
MSRILAIDSGLTVTKAVIFDTEGRQVAVARRNVRQSMPAPRHVERDMDDLWRQTASAIREAMAASGTAPGGIAAVAATAHGDGVYLLDREAAPLGRGVLSLDSRAAEVVRDWQADGTGADSLRITGQVPHASAPSALLRWIRDREPERFARIGHLLACKDWLRARLTGTIGTDRTEASTSFADVGTQAWSEEALALFGLGALRDALPEVGHSAQVVGAVTAEAAALTGLAEGTPVAAGLHDVTASALGIGAHQPGIVGIVAGTYSINECVSAAPAVDPGWFCRSAIEPGLWNTMSISPASTTNYDWFLGTFCGADRILAEREGRSIHEALSGELKRGLSRASSVIYHPYLFGSPRGAEPSASLIGLRGWHDRGDVLAALMEGIVFNHREHVDLLRGAFPAEEARLTGGASRNPAVAQLFADVLGMPVTVTETDEAAAWGAALCAGAAVGLFSRFDADPRDLAAASVRYVPDGGRRAHYEGRYRTYLASAAALEGTWGAVNALDVQGRTPGDG